VISLEIRSAGLGGPVLGQRATSSSRGIVPGRQRLETQIGAILAVGSGRRKSAHQPLALWAHCPSAANALLPIGSAPDVTGGWGYLVSGLRVNSGIR
jgi:hypothetical protein